MEEKVIHVTLNADLVAALDTRARSEGRSRSEIIRDACQEYLESPTSEQKQQWDQQYVESYRKHPEQWDPDEWKEFWPASLRERVSEADE